MKTSAMPPMEYYGVDSNGHSAPGAKGAALVVLWADMVGFTAYSSTRHPLAVMDVLSEIYSHFDGLVQESPCLWKLDTVGDAYVVVGGLQQGSAPPHTATVKHQDPHTTLAGIADLDAASVSSRFDSKSEYGSGSGSASGSGSGSGQSGTPHSVFSRATRRGFVTPAKHGHGGAADTGADDVPTDRRGLYEAVEATIKVAVAMQQYIEHRRDADGLPVNMRVGVHVGPAVTGVVGQLRPRFHVFGDTLLQAESLESSATPGMIHISAEARAIYFEGILNLRTPTKPTAGDTDSDGTAETTHRQRGLIDSPHKVVDNLSELFATPQPSASGSASAFSYGDTDQQGLSPAVRPLRFHSPGRESPTTADLGTGSFIGRRNDIIQLQPYAAGNHNAPQPLKIPQTPAMRSGRERVIRRSPSPIRELDEREHSTGSAESAADDTYEERRKARRSFAEESAAHSSPVRWFLNQSRQRPSFSFADTDDEQPAQRAPQPHASASATSVASAHTFTGPEFVHRPSVNQAQQRPARTSSASAGEAEQVRHAPDTRGAQCARSSQPTHTKSSLTQAASFYSTSGASVLLSPREIIDGFMGAKDTSPRTDTAVHGWTGGGSMYSKPNRPLAIDTLRGGQFGAQNGALSAPHGLRATRSFQIPAHSIHTPAFALRSTREAAPPKRPTASSEPNQQPLQALLTLPSPEPGTLPADAMDPTTNGQEPSVPPRDAGRSVARGFSSLSSRIASDPAMLQPDDGGPLTGDTVTDLFASKLALSSRTPPPKRPERKPDHREDNMKSGIPQHPWLKTAPKDIDLLPFSPENSRNSGLTDQADPRRMSSGDPKAGKSLRLMASNSTDYSGSFHSNPSFTIPQAPT